MEAQSPNRAIGRHGTQGPFGDLRSSEGASLGGHRNPTAAVHGLPGKVPRHLGDLGNLEAEAAGTASLSRVFAADSTDGDLSSVTGRGVVDRALPDDRGQPSGNVGGRIAVGVTGAAQADAGS